MVDIRNPTQGGHDGFFEFFLKFLPESNDYLKKNAKIWTCLKHFLVPGLGG